MPLKQQESSTSSKWFERKSEKLSNEFLDDFDDEVNKMRNEMDERMNQREKDWKDRIKEPNVFVKESNLESPRHKIRQEKRIYEMCTSSASQESTNNFGSLDDYTPSEVTFEHDKMVVTVDLKDFKPENVQKHLVLNDDSGLCGASFPRVGHAKHSDASFHVITSSNRSVRQDLTSNKGFSASMSDVPGYQDILAWVKIKDRALTVEGQIENNTETNLSKRSVTRRFILPQNADVERITSTWNEKVLTIDIPSVKKEVKEKEIEIKIG